MKFIVFIFLLAIQGCALRQDSISDIKSRADKQNWEYTYNRFDYFLSKNNEKYNQQLILIAKDYPEILEYAQTKFSIDVLSDMAIRANDLTYKKNELERFCKVFTLQQCNQAVDNMAQAEKIIKKELRLRRDLFAGLTIKEQKSLSDNYKLIIYEINEIGVITDRQIQNISTAGSNAGAEIGGAVGATAYISNSNPYNYSLKNDIGSTILGAFVGAALMNQPAVNKYLIRYTIKLTDGNFRQYEEVLPSALGQGIGLCISLPGVISIDTSICTMTLAEFRVKYAGELNN